jgi:hypothetical protein
MTTTQVQQRRGTASQIAAATPAQGELWWDETFQRVVGGDGATQGGWAHALSTRTAVSDAAYTALATDCVIAYTAITAARIVSLPAAAGFATGRVLWILDESGSVTATHTISVARNGSDTINGGSASAVIAGAYGILGLESNGSNGWVIVHTRTNSTARTAVSDAAYTALVTDRMIAYTALTAARIVSLPASSAYPSGTLLWIIDESGNASGSLTITAAANGGDTIVGGAQIKTANGFLALESNQSGQWSNLAGGAGGVTSVATAYPVGGGTITGSGTIKYVGPTQSGYFSVSGADALFAPKNGDTVRINGVVYQIPSGGIAGANGSTSAFSGSNVFVNGTGASNLANATFYYVYAFINSGTVTADFRTDGNGHMPDTTSGNVGTEVRVSSGTTPDPTRTLIGMVYTGSSAFVNMQTASWYNRKPKTATTNFTANRTTTSATFAELNSEIRNAFVAWADSAVDVRVSGTSSNSTGANGFGAGLSFNGGTVEANATALAYNASNNVSIYWSVSEMKTGLTEAQNNYATLFGAAPGTTVTFYYQTIIVNGTSATQISVTIWG